MKSAYKAVEVSAPGVLRVVERQVTQPGVGQVRIRVEACGICHTDAATHVCGCTGSEHARQDGEKQFHDRFGNLTTGKG